MCILNSLLFSDWFIFNAHSIIIFFFFKMHMVISDVI